jgi:signal transduction histidine kinase
VDLLKRIVAIITTIIQKPSLENTGIGIDSDVFPNLFSKFGVIRETSGNGLGLLISKMGP